MNVSLQGTFLTVLLLLVTAINSLDPPLKKQTPSKNTDAKKAETLDLEEAASSSFTSSFHSFSHSFLPPITLFPDHSYFSSLLDSANSIFSAYGSHNHHPAKAINCGDSFSRKCRKSRYRTYDGSCNNLYNPTWGMANTRYARLSPAIYADGVHVPTRSVTGQELPLPRVVSTVLSPEVNLEDPQWTLAAMQWGQVVTHDMGLIDGTIQAKPHPTTCCTADGQFMEEAQKNPFCYPIVVPDQDPIFAGSGIKCMNFVRSRTDIDRGCSKKYKPAEQLNTVSHFLDLSLVYGNTERIVDDLRAGIGGRLTVDIRNGKQWLPASHNKTGTCDVNFENEYCYRTGDIRSNQNPQLTILLIILLREHNRVADALSAINPHWDDETIFQETRRIVIAEHQHITIYEWLPIYVGWDNRFLEYDGYLDNYDASVNPSVLNEHSNAAFRYFHTLIAGHLQLVNEQRFTSPCPALRLSDHLDKPGVIEEGNNMDDLTRGMVSQPQQASDQYFDNEITQYLFRNNSAGSLGSDLRATDIQRNRDHGLASYNSIRKICGLPKATNWADFEDLISPENINKLAQLYATPDDVDLTVGGSLETIANSGLTGPTFTCILLEQFRRTQKGDRYWFESGDSQIAFTIEQLTELRKSSISRLLCDNGDNIRSMQALGFKQISANNPVVPCDQLPAVNLSLWKDYAPLLSA